MLIGICIVVNLINDLILVTFDLDLRASELLSYNFRCLVRNSMAQISAPMRGEHNLKILIYCTCMPSRHFVVVHEPIQKTQLP